MKKGQTKLYNVLFPIWMFYFLPTVVWLILLPGNFLIDSLVLLAAMKVFGIAGKLTIWKRSILKVWLFGFAADFAGGGVVFALMLLLERLAPRLNTFLIPGGQIIVLPGIALAGWLIYLLNKTFSFRGTGLAEGEIRRLSLSLALWTAPYTMLIPVEWIY